MKAVQTFVLIINVARFFLSVYNTNYPHSSSSMDCQKIKKNSLRFTVQPIFLHLPAQSINPKPNLFESI